MPAAANPFQLALNQARMLQQQRRFPEAEAAYKQLLNVPGATEAVWGHLLQLYAQMGRWTDVESGFEKLIKLRPNDLFYYDKLANFLQKQGNGEKAIDCYRRLLKRQPKMADAYFNMAYLERLNRHFTDAVTSYEKALALGISQPEEVYLNIAAIQSDNLRNEEAAERALQKALKINARYVPALLNLGNLREEQGNDKEARALYEQILQLSPHHADALARLANLTPIDSGQNPMIARLQYAAADKTQPALERSILYYALGKALDSCKEFPEAFKAYHAANEASKADGSRPYNRAAQKQQTDALIGTFSKNWFDGLEPISEAEPVFICGMFRSGSTLTEQVLASHSNVTAGGEIDFFPSLVTGRLAPFPASLTHQDRTAFREIAEEYLAATRKMFPDAQLLTDKRPDNFLYLGLIKTLFPKAKIVHTTRHPLDTSLSIYFQYLSGYQPYAKDLMDIGHYYAEYLRLMDHWLGLFGDDIFEMNYDRFVADAKGQTKALLDFLGLPWADSCLEFHKADNSVKTASYWQVREPLYSRSSQRWKNYERELEPLRQFFMGKNIPC